MAVYTVFEPRQPTAAGVDRADRFVFIRDRFSWSAFLFGPLWMLRHRLWLALVVYVVIMAAIQIGLRLAGAPPGATLTVMALIALLLGFEAPTLRRAKLVRRGWTEHGPVIADDRDAAERRFFAAWVAEGADAAAPSAPPPPPSYRTMGPSASGIIGLFPEPGSSR